MPPWLFLFMLTAGVLFALKIVYVLSTAAVLPFTRGALYVSTSRTRISAFLDAIPMNPGQVLVDLGCGDGRVLREAYRRYGTRGIGYELNPLAYVRARLQCIPFRGIRISRESFWDVSLAEADIVFCYLFPDVMKRLADKISKEAAPGMIVVSANFSLPGFAPEHVLRPGNSLHNDPIYIYRL